MACCQGAVGRPLQNVQAACRTMPSTAGTLLSILWSFKSFSSLLPFNMQAPLLNGAQVRDNALEKGNKPYTEGASHALLKARGAAEVAGVQAPKPPHSMTAPKPALCCGGLGTCRAVQAGTPARACRLFVTSQAARHINSHPHPECSPFSGCNRK